jgi:outer membrane lipoprotein-sorting protein
MRTILRLGMFALLLRVALAQTPDVQAILSKAAETYKAASQYELVADISERQPGASSGPSGRMYVAFNRGKGYRMEGAIPGMGAVGFDEATMVYDGSTVWFYLPKSNQYGSFPASALTADAPGDLGDLRPEAMDGFLMGRYRSAADTSNRAKLLREETIQFGGGKTECYVVSVSMKESQNVYTWWIDKKLYRILREEDDQSVTVFTTVKLGEQPADDLFRFKPPAGARKIETQR